MRLQRKKTDVSNQSHDAVRDYSWRFVANVSPFSGAGQVLELYRSHLRSQGVPAQVFMETSVRLRTIVRLSLRIILATEQNLVVRFSPYLLPALTLSALSRRLTRRLLILHVPTPVQAGYREIRLVSTRRTALFLSFLIRLTYPLACLAANRVVQNGQAEAEDPAWIRRKSLVLPNPARHPRLIAPAREAANELAEIVLVGVAANGYYHGYSRVLSGLIEYCRGGGPGKFRIELIGPMKAFAEELRILERAELGPHRVSLVGAISEEEVIEHLREAHAALGVLATHRTGLTLGSPLRHRLYLHAGIPWISSLADVGLHEPASFVMRVPADESPIDLAEAVEWLRSSDWAGLDREMSEAVRASSAGAVLASMSS